MKARINWAVLAIGSAVIVGNGVYQIRKTRNVEREKRKQILNDMGLDVAAIHNATDVINERIDRGEIRSLEELRDAVLTEVAFQKIAIHEEL